MAHFNLYLGDCLETLKGFPDESFDSGCTDPPYGLSDHEQADVEACLTAWLAGEEYKTSKKGFMSRAWDSWVPGPEVWREVYRVLKPGAFLAVFAGTRTMDLMGIALRLGGFKPRDMMAWEFGCLSEDTEILVDGQWQPYHKATTGRLALCYDTKHGTYQWQEIQELLVYDYSDIAFRVHSDFTDQIVSRNHRCLVERSGAFEFALAEDLACERQARVPVLEGLPDLLGDLPLPQQGASDQKHDVLNGVRCTASEFSPSARASVRTPWNGAIELHGLRLGVLAPPCLAKKDSTTDVLLPLQREGTSDQFGETLSQGGGQSVARVHGQSSREDVRNGKSRMEGRGNFQAKQRELHRTEVCAMPPRSLGDGNESWLCHGAPTGRGAVDRSPLNPEGSRPSRQPQHSGQSPRESDAVCDKPGSQIVRGERYTRSDLATITPFFYCGIVWCVRVPSGAFVARRNGKVFVTGNSGFPKNLDIAAAIDLHHFTGWLTAWRPKAKRFARKLWSATDESRWVWRWCQIVSARLNGETLIGKREVVAKAPQNGAKFKTTAETIDNGGFNAESRTEYAITEPATDDAKRWDGWGTALKPAFEPILLCRKPVIKNRTVAEQVLETGTGGLNIDACRIGQRNQTVVRGGRLNGEEADPSRLIYGKFGHDDKIEEFHYTEGRWPANLLLQHSVWCYPRGGKVVIGDGHFPKVRGPNSGVWTNRSGLHRGQESAEHDLDHETVVDWCCHESCPVRLLAEQSGESGGSKPIARANGEQRLTGATYSGGKNYTRSYTSPGYNDKGDASRFFAQFHPFFYQGKATRAERDAGCEELDIKTGGELTSRKAGSAGLKNPRAGSGRTSGGRNTHPTVKPTEMMAYLVRLLTPPGGTTLDPFLGSGSTGVAAMREGFDFVGCELSEEYMDIARYRIEHHREPEIHELPLFAALSPAPEEVATQQASLFDAIAEEA